MAKEETKGHRSRLNWKWITEVRKFTVRTAYGDESSGCGYGHEYDLLKWCWEERI